MSSRQEEKQRRKEERLAQERAEASAAQRKRLMTIVGGVILVAAVVVAVVLAASGGGEGGGDGGPSDSPEASVPIPAPQEEDLEAAVEAAGCEVEELESFGQEHTEEPLTAADYESNPPTSGQHAPVPAEDGVYNPGNSPPIANWMHTLEHGRVILMYAPGTPQRRIGQLGTLYNEPVNDGPEGYHSVLMQNNSEMPYEVAAVAWRRFIGCEKFNDRAFDALREFRSTFVDQAPELVP